MQLQRQKLVMLQQATLQRLGPVGQQQLSMLAPEQRKAEMLELMKDTQRLQQHQQQVGSDEAGLQCAGDLSACLSGGIVAA